MTYKQSPSYIDHTGIGDDVGTMITSFTTVLQRLLETIKRLSSRHGVIKLFIALFVISVLFVGVMVNFTIHKDICQDDRVCINRHNERLIVATCMLGGCVVFLVMYSYAKMYPKINKLLSTTIGMIQVPFIALPTGLAMYALYVIITEKLNIVKIMLKTYQYLFTGQFKKLWRHVTDENTKKVWLYYSILYLSIGLGVASAIFAFGLVMVPIGKITWFITMVTLVFMWIPAFDYVFDVMDVNDDHAVSKKFSSGIYVIYPIAFLVCFYVLFIILFYFSFIGR